MLFGSVLLLVGAFALSASAAEESKIHWVDIRSFNVEGKGWTNTESFYDRLPARAADLAPKSVWHLSKQSAGMLVRFITDATTLHAKWAVTSDRLAMPHMTATGVSGLDLYVRDGNSWKWLGSGQPKEQTNTVVLIADMDPGEREYMLYLPLYNGVHFVEIGVEEGRKLETAGPWGRGDRKPIVFYGTSIQQGGCASRPGMVHSSILGRRFNWPTINLGFSGSGKMEPVMGDLVSELDASVFVLDCLPNMDAAMLRERFEPFVRRLRAAHPKTPIVMVEDRPFSNAYLVRERRERHASNRAVTHEVFQRLKKEGFKDIYYIKGETLLGTDHEGTVDGSHPTDLGFTRQADVLAKVLKPLLKAK